MTIRRFAVPGLMALAMLAACSKQAPPPQPADEPVAKPPVEQPPRPDKPLEYDRDKMVSELLALIDTVPQCEQFRAQLEAEGKNSDGPLMGSEVGKMNAIVGRAMEAGCYRKPQN